MTPPAAKGPSPDEELSDLILRYGVILGRRFTRSQKRRFLLAAAHQFELCGLDVSLEESKRPVRTAGSKRYFNLYAGNPRKADWLFVTCYDTPAKRFRPGRPRAFETGYGTADALASLAALAALVVAAAVFLWRVVVPAMGDSGVLSLWGALFLLVCVVVLAVVTRCREGFAERDNLVRNSSSLVVLFDLASELCAAGVPKGRVAFALVDEGCRSQRGLDMLAQRLGGRHPRQVYVDCLGGGGDAFCLTRTKVSDALRARAHVRPLSTELRARYGDYLLCAGEETQDGYEVLPRPDLGVDTVRRMTSLLRDLSGL